MTTIRLAEFFGRLSLPFEAGSDVRPGRSVRAAVLGVELGRRAGAGTDELRDAYWLALAGPRPRAERWLQALREVFATIVDSDAPPPALEKLLAAFEASTT